MNEVKEWMRAAAMKIAGEDLNDDWVAEIIASHAPAEAAQAVKFEKCKKCGKSIFWHGDSWYHESGEDVMKCGVAEAAPDSVGSPQKCPTCGSDDRGKFLAACISGKADVEVAHSWHDSVGEAPQIDIRAKNYVGEAPAAQKETAQTQSGIMPLTYEQEVHSILWAAAAITGDLILCFKAQAARETGETKKLTQKCIAWREDDLRRIKALIPQALERRDAAPAQSLYEAPPTVADALRLLRKIEGCSGDAAKLILLKHFRAAGRQEGWEAAIKASLACAQAEFDVPPSEGNNIARQDACDNVMRAIRALTPSPEPAQKGK